MVDLLESRLDFVFHALGDVTRRRMLRRLAGGEHTVSQLAEPFNMSLAAASKHIKALEGAGLIRREIRGRTHVCYLNADPLSSANEWLRYYEQFWSMRLDRLEGLLRGDSTTLQSSAGSSDATAPRKARGSSPNLRKRSTR